MPSAYRKKLIEVALPLDAINKESAREKSIRHGHPSTLHLWWARRPLAACRAVLFSQLVDDPSEYMPDEKSADEERERLFKIIEDLVLWENINNEEVLDKARLEIARSVARDLGVEAPVGKEAIREFLATKAPPVLDPFAGGGSIPLEAQRLGLRAYASDLNPVAVLINKALIEIPPKFAGMPPVHPPESKEQQLSLMKKEWKGAKGLAEDVRYYGKWMRDEAEKRIGHLYPKYKITQELLHERPDLKAQGLRTGDELTVIAWLWARTVSSPNPLARGKHIPLIRSFWLANNPKRKIWIEPVVSLSDMKYRFQVRIGKGEPPEGTVKKGREYCLLTKTPITREYIRSEGVSNRMNKVLIAVVANGIDGRAYLDSTHEHEEIANSVADEYETPDTEIIGDSRYLTPVTYGLKKHKDLFTTRQQTSLMTLISTLHAVHQKILVDSDGDEAYADVVCTYLAFACDKIADRNSSLCSWATGREHPINTFTRSAYSMVWDFTEINIFSDAAGSFMSGIDTITAVLKNLWFTNPGIVLLANASFVSSLYQDCVVSTDPPYYDNVPYADLSDFFYVWLRKSLQNIYPDVFKTLLVPKTEELVADPFRQGNKENAKLFFETGIQKAFDSIKQASISSVPVTIYYAFKQAEESFGEDVEEIGNNNKYSTGWETFLEGLLMTGWAITGTWPVRTELSRRMRNLGSNALASSIVLVCRPRVDNAPNATRRDFLFALKQEIPSSLRKLQMGSIAPVDMAQAAIGPGMAVFSRYNKVLDADGSPMSVRAALGLINQALDEFLAEQEGEYDADTRWALAWYEQYGFNDGPYGVAETLSKAKNTSVGGLEEAGVLVARAGKVRLLSRTELNEDWDPSQDKRPTDWEAVQYLIRALDTHGEQDAALLLSRLGGLGETARDLAYRLYTICERKGWAQDALGYNMLVVAWPRLKEMARSARPPEQGRLI